MGWLKDFEFLRGEPIQVFVGDPMDIPCVETSDPERLCKHPVVSVHMLAYNHEPYVRQAIEGVMMQKTDFEFELVIGEDCSTDKTREICFEYQKRYPDKIRVLWCDHNLYRIPHPAGGNGLRTLVHCRGEFIAYCEGDDYWTDPLKLQKQVDVFRANSSVVMCFTDAKAFDQETGMMHESYADVPWGASRLITGDEFLSEERRPITLSVMYSRAALETAKQQFDIFNWRLLLGDHQTWLGLASNGDCYYINEKTGVYRRHADSATNSNGLRVSRDFRLVILYFIMRGNVPPRFAPGEWKVLYRHRCDLLVDSKDVKAEAEFLLTSPYFRSFVTWPMRRFLLATCKHGFSARRLKYARKFESSPFWIVQSFTTRVKRWLGK